LFVRPIQFDLFRVGTDCEPVAEKSDDPQPTELQLRIYFITARDNNS
jgi:hypothetical protein